MGTLGKDYPGYFEVGNVAQLALLLQKAELDSVFYDELKAQCAKVANLVDPDNERQAWNDLAESLLR